MAWYACMYIHMYVHAVYCKSLRWKSFAVFADRLITAKFSSEIACAIGFGHTYMTIVQSQILSSELHFSSATTKLFDLKRFAIDGNSTYVYIRMYICTYRMYVCTYIHTYIHNQNTYKQTNISQTILVSVFVHHHNPQLTILYEYRE